MGISSQGSNWLGHAMCQFSPELFGQLCVRVGFE